MLTAMTTMEAEQSLDLTENMAQSPSLQPMYPNILMKYKHKGQGLNPAYLTKEQTVTHK